MKPFQFYYNDQWYKGSFLISGSKSHGFFWCFLESDELIRKVGQCLIFSFSNDTLMPAKAYDPALRGPGRSCARSGVAALRGRGGEAPVSMPVSRPLSIAGYYNCTFLTAWFATLIETIEVVAPIAELERSCQKKVVSTCKDYLTLNTTQCFRTCYHRLSQALTDLCQFVTFLVEVSPVANRPFHAVPVFRLYAKVQGS